MKDKPVLKALTVDTQSFANFFQIIHNLARCSHSHTHTHTQPFCVLDPVNALLLFFRETYG